MRFEYAHYEKRRTAVFFAVRLPVAVPRGKATLMARARKVSPPAKSPRPPQPGDRLAKYRWKKGQSGNPGGAPKQLREVVLLARQFTAQAIHELALIMLNHSYKPRDRAYAAALILDRGLGRTPQTVKLEEDTVGEKSRGAEQAREVVQDVGKLRRMIEILHGAGALEMVVGKGYRALESPIPVEEVVGAAPATPEE